MNQHINTQSMGCHLRSARSKKDLTITEFAKTAGMTGRYLSDIERGQKVPKMDTFVKLVNLLDVSLDEVLCDSLKLGYRVRATILTEKLELLTPLQRAQVLNVVETMLNNFQNA